MWQIAGPLTIASLVAGVWLSCAKTAAADDLPGLVGYWDFEEGEGEVAHDRSGAGNDGVVRGAAWRKGAFGTALWFDGLDDYVEIKDASSLNFTGPFSLEAWVNADRIWHAAKIVCKRGLHGNGGYWLDQIQGARMCLYCGGEAVGVYPRATSKTYLSPGRWYHMVGTYSDGLLRVYINGTLEGKVAGPDRPDSTKGIDLLIGTYAPKGIYRWTGLIDEVRIYNRALTPEEAKRRFDGTSERYLGSREAAFLDFSPSTVLLWPGKAQSIGVTVFNHGEKAVHGSVGYEVRDGEQGTILKGRTEDANIPARGQTQVRFAFTPTKPGRLFLRCWWGEEEQSAWQRGLLCVEPLPQPRQGTGLRLEQLEKIDCTQNPSAEKYCDDGLAKVVEGPIGSYRETGAKQDSRFAYRFRVKHPQRPHLLAVEYPDDKMRFMDINFCSPNRAQNYDIATGALCGGEYPLTNRFQTHPIIFWPTDEDNAVFVMSWRGQPAAARSIAVHEIRDGFPSLPVREPEGEPVRLIGHQWEDPSLPTGYGGAYDLVGFYNTISRMAQYFRFTGQNLFTYPIVFYTGPFYPSRVETPAAEPRFGVADTEDWVRMILQLFEREKCCFIPSLTLLRLPSLLEQQNTDMEQIRAGADTINVIIRNNTVRSSADVHGESAAPRGYKRQGPTGPVFNVLHPKVQSAALRLVGEILDRYGDSPAFKGIALNMWIENMLWFGSLDSGYGDYEVGLFEKETGASIPADAKDPERFSKRYGWLMANAKEKWINWRCRKIHELWMRIYDMVRAKRPDLQLVIHCWLPYHVWADKREDYWYPGSLTRWASGEQTIEEIYREGGLDLGLYRGKPGLVIERQMFPADARGQGNGPAGPPQAQAFRDFNFDPAAFAPYRNGDGSAVFIYNNYFENAVGRDHPLPGLWWKENPWRASAISPAHRNFLEAYAEPLAQLDMCQITNGGTTCGTQGFEEYVQEFTQAYRALPARPFEDFPPAEDPVRIRYLKAGDKFYFYLVNRLAEPVDVTLTITCGAETRIVDLSSGEEQRQAARGDQVELGIPLKPFQLRSFAATPHSLVFRAVHVSVPEGLVQGLRGRVEEIRQRLLVAEKAGLAVTQAKLSLEQVDQALRKQRYARALHLIESYTFKNLARQLDARKQETPAPR